MCRDAYFGIGSRGSNLPASGGSGPGLPIVKWLVAAAGGDLHLEVSGAGADFVLDLPVA